MELILIIFFVWTYCFSIVLNFIQYFENQEKEEVIFSYIEKVENLKTRAINLAREKLTQTRELKHTICEMKKTWIRNRKYIVFWIHYFKKILNNKKRQYNSNESVV